MDKLKITQLVTRLQEMNDCEVVDPENKTTYDHAFLIMFGAMGKRYGSFINRHQLREQFLAEDEQGTR
jgi:hypothetical protein